METKITFHPEDILFLVSSVRTVSTMEIVHNIKTTLNSFEFSQNCAGY